MFSISVRKTLVAVVALLLGLVSIPAAAGFNVRFALAQLDPDVAASAEIEGIAVNAGIDANNGFGLGLEYESRRIAIGFEAFQTEHDIDYSADIFGFPISLNNAGQVELLTALISLRYRINPDSRVVVSIGPVLGGIGYTDFELPDGETDDGGTAVFGGEIAVDVALTADEGWFLRGAYRLLDGDLEIDEQLGLDVDIDPEDDFTQFLDTPFDPSLLSVEIGYRF